MQGALLLEMGKRTITYSAASNAPYPEFIYGLQSIGINTNFNLEQIFQMGQLSLYFNAENVPDVEVSLEKVLDGRPLMYHMATPKASGVGLSSRAGINDRADLRMAILRDTDTAFNSAANLGIQGEVYVSGSYVTQLSYSIPTEGNMTESLTLAANNILWNVGTIMSGNLNLGNDSPDWSGPQGNKDTVLRRQHFDTTNSIIPIDIPGYSSADLSSASTLDYGYKLGASNGKTHISSISLSASLNRTSINELGRKGPYYRSIEFPIEVTSEFEVIALSGSLVQAYEEGFPVADSARGISAGDNLGNRRIQLHLADGTIFNLGTKNKLQSVTYGGADTGGGNASMTFSYSNFNDLEIFHSGDPAGHGRGMTQLGLK
jgi:hypothetical protein